MLITLRAQRVKLKTICFQVNPFLEKKCHPKAKKKKCALL